MKLTVNIYLLRKEDMELNLHDRYTTFMSWIALQGKKADYKMSANSSSRLLPQ